MKNFVYFQSDDNENPLENMDIVCINRQNTNTNELSKKLKKLTDMGYQVFPVHVYDHSGRVFKRTPFNDQWDSYLYGFFAFPKEYACTEEFLDSMYELYGYWAEGEVYDVILLEGESISPKYITDCYMDSINLYDLYEKSNSELMSYMKEKKLKHSNFESDLYDKLYNEFKSRYAGYTKQHGLISMDIMERDKEMFYGTEDMEKYLEKI